MLPRFLAGQVREPRAIWGERSPAGVRCGQRHGDVSQSSVRSEPLNQAVMARWQSLRRTDIPGSCANELGVGDSRCADRRADTTPNVGLFREAGSCLQKSALLLLVAPIRIFRRVENSWQLSRTCG